MSPKLVSMTSVVVLALALGTLVTVPMRVSSAPATSPDGLSVRLPARPVVVQAPPPPAAKRVSAPKPNPKPMAKPRRVIALPIGGSPPPARRAVERGPPPAPVSSPQSAPQPAPAPPLPPPAPRPPAVPPALIALPAPSPPALFQTVAQSGEWDEEDEENRGNHSGWDNDSPADHDHGRGNDDREHGRGKGGDK